MPSHPLALHPARRRVGLHAAAAGAVAFLALLLGGAAPVRSTVGEGSGEPATPRPPGFLEEDAPSPAPPPPGARLRGDASGDFAVRAVDALAILTDVVERPLPPGYVVERVGDGNCDGTVTALDALLALSATVGRDVSEFCVGTVMPESLSLQGDTVRLVLEDREPLQAIALDGAGQPLDLSERGTRVTSSDSAVVDVRPDGVVEALAFGVVTVTVTVEDLTVEGTARVGGLVSADGDVIISSEDDLSAFHDAGWTSVSGSLYLSGTALTRLDGLEELREIHGSVLVDDTPSSPTSEASAACATWRGT